MRFVPVADEMRGALKSRNGSEVWTGAGCTGFESKDRRSSIALKEEA